MTRRKRAPDRTRHPEPWLVATVLAAAPFAAVVAQDARTVGGYVPRLEVRDSDVFDNGRSIHHDIVVVREVSPRVDEKVVIVKTVVNQLPTVQGLHMWGGRESEDNYGNILTLPLHYEVETTLTAPDLQDGQVRLISQAPRSDGATDRTFVDKVGVKTSVGAGASTELTAAVSKDSGFSWGKLPVSFNAGFEQTSERSVTMTLKDYFTESAVTKNAAGEASALWRFRLAPDIANDVWYSYSHYRVGPGWLFTLPTTTPMMQRATIETVSEWRLPGGYSGPIDIATRSSVDNSTRLAPTSSMETWRDEDAGIGHLTRIDLGSPHLERQPVVRLQSLAGEGHCLTQSQRDQPAVALAPCKGGTDGAEQQWYLDSDHTYRNVASRLCLAADPAGGGVRTESCAGSMLNKQWQWRADRLHSTYMDGGSWRLHVRDGVPRAIFDPVRHQEIGSNPFHHLLRPWSSYPQAPTPGDVVPAVAGASPAISQGLLRHKAVSAEERWQPLPIDSNR
ncbi:MAG: RICIN domain-containing protein [Luteibacter sp.]|uniref:RICIN domain-containing protein n=1 Tax=Luteibacter sp. TaxID=1886636 RepID=UPI002807B399|nr:RICIN domain-containing protein [Luteibacter sp.]MDQ7994288.1 RICIN domain-containing protein [Luteibacter sp.]MDQ8048588.1 RICIN domain-containing protein [Luteibacter sp.]